MAAEWPVRAQVRTHLRGFQARPLDWLLPRLPTVLLLATSTSLQAARPTPAFELAQVSLLPAANVAAYVRLQQSGRCQR